MNKFSQPYRWQIHGIDSITEVHGMEGQVAWREVHPVSSYLFGKYTKLTAHLLTKHPLILVCFPGEIL